MNKNRPNPNYVDALKTSVNVAGFPNHMGFVLEEIDLGRCRLRLPLGPQHLQPYGIVHGGVMATLIDTATFWAVFFSLEDQGTGLVNVDLKLNYLKPCKAGILNVVGKEIRSGRTILYSEAHVYDSTGEILAHGTSTLMALPGKGLSIPYPKFV